MVKKREAQSASLRLSKKAGNLSGSLVQRELSAKLTEGLFYEMFQIFSYILEIFNVSFTTPPSKIKDFCHLPLHRGGFGCFFDKLKQAHAIVRRGPVDRFHPYFWRYSVSQ